MRVTSRQGEIRRRQTRPRPRIQLDPWISYSFFFFFFFNPEAGYESQQLPLDGIKTSEGVYICG